MREVQDRRGYLEVSTPMVVASACGRQSGHWDLYKENMFLSRVRARPSRSSR